MATKARKIPIVKNYRVLRARFGLDQTTFWARVGVTQSAGSRIEKSGRAKKHIAVLVVAVYVQGFEIDARDYK